MAKKVKTAWGLRVETWDALEELCRKIDSETDACARTVPYYDSDDPAAERLWAADIKDHAKRFKAFSKKIKALVAKLPDELP